MGLADDYRRHAAECLEVAATLADPQKRMAMIAMAESWRHLAMQAEKNLRTDVVYETHPWPAPKPIGGKT